MRRREAAAAEEEVAAAELAAVAAEEVAAAEGAVEQRVDRLDGLREALGLRNPDAPELPSESLLPSGARSVTPKDVAIGIALLLQVRHTDGKSSERASG